MGERRGTKALELWCRRMIEGYKDVRVDNMTTSWRDGRAFCALVSKCSSLRNLPDLIEFEQLKKEDIYENNEKAFRIAEEYFNIPSLLDPHDMVKYDVPDKLSVLTYLSQFYQVFGTYDISLKSKETSADNSDEKTKSPPPQMSSQSVPQRKPCFVCANPVFFAERLFINSNLYHRSCFQCARCHSVLTLGNFYETENENEFCCETCPDEEKFSQQKNLVSTLVESTETSDVLRKSMSDEEKSANLLISQSRQKVTSTSEIEIDDISDLDDDNDSENVDSSFNMIYESVTSDEVVVEKEKEKVPEVVVVEELKTSTTPLDDIQLVNERDDHQNDEVVENPNNSKNIFIVDEEDISSEISTINDLVNESVIQSEEVNVHESHNNEELKLKNEKDKSEEEERSSEKLNENATEKILTNNEIIEVEDKSIEEINESKTLQLLPVIKVDDDEKYPETLNPFDDSDTEDHQPVIEKEKQDKKSLNPFGSDSEEDEKTPTTIKSATKSNSTSLNPFGDSSDDENHSINQSSKAASNVQKVGIGAQKKGHTLKKKKAPKPPTPQNVIQSPPPIIQQSLESDKNTPTPKKKRPAPRPPQFAGSTSTIAEIDQSIGDLSISSSQLSSQHEQSLESIDQTQLRRKLSIDESLNHDTSNSMVSDLSDSSSLRRRKLVPLQFQKHNDVSSGGGGDLEKDKDEKDLSNFNLRHSSTEASVVNDDENQENDEDSAIFINKSSHGKWKRRKDRPAPIPGFAQPTRRILQMLPLQDIRQELEKIEIQQQGLEKQGVILEKMIRERCENDEDNKTAEETLEASKSPPPESKNSKEVEDLIIQLFELVNEKNELFRRQAELMYLRRAYRLEEEQADVEFEIRKLLGQPESNKTDHDKAREEALIQRLVEIVKLRDEIVDNLDRDRLREVEEDKSIKKRLESHTAQLEKLYNASPATLSKKEKKKLKELKKMKNKKNDVDKDLDTTETKSKKSDKKKGLGFFKRSS